MVRVRAGAIRRRTVREYKVDAGREGEYVCGEAGVLKAGGSAHGRPYGEHSVPAWLGVGSGLRLGLGSWVMGWGHGDG